MRRALLIAWSHSGRLRSEAAFARLAGVTHAASLLRGQSVRHRLNRAVNRALHMTVLSRLAHDDRTQA